MKRLRSLLLLLCIVHFGYAQNYDRNWVFGTNAGINFHPFGTISNFNTKVTTSETTGCISDSLGNLLFYISNLNSQNGDILNVYGNQIYNGDSIKIYHSNSSGVIIIHSYGLQRYLIFHMEQSPYDPQCLHPFCPKLLLTIIRNEAGNLQVEKKNIPLLNQPLFEKLSAVKHANGKDWWLVAYTAEQIGSNVNRLYTFLVVDTTIYGPYHQNVQPGINRNFDSYGQMKFSRNGDYLAIAFLESKALEIYSFNRCTGYFTSFIPRTHLNVNEIYGLEFSPENNYLYISCGWGYSIGNKLYQMDLMQPQNFQEIASTSYIFGQL